MKIFSKNTDKPVQQKQIELENKLSKYILLIQNIQRYKNDSQKIFKEIQQYDKCKDEGYKEYFRIKIKDLISQINKEVDIFHLVKQTISIEQKLNRGVAKYKQIEQKTKFEKQIEQKIDKLNLLETNNVGQSHTFQNINLMNKIRELKKNSIKYNYTLKALQTFEKRERNFIDYMGQADLRLFQIPQFAIFDSFTQRINGRKIQIFSINVEKQLQIISNTIDEMQNVQSLQEIQKIARNKIKKIENQGFFLKLISKQKQKLTIFEMIQDIQKCIGKSSDLLNMRNYIKMNLNLKPKIKNSLDSINSNLYNLSKFQQIFQSHQIKMTQQKIKQIFIYLDNLQKMLKINIEQLQQKIYKKKSNQDNIKDESPKFFNLMKYFERLIKLIDLNFIPKDPQLKQFDYKQEYLPLSEEIQKLKQDLAQKQMKIQNLQWKVNYLAPKLQNSQNENRILQTNLNELGIKVNENNIWKEKHDKLVLQLQTLKTKKSSNLIIEQDKPRNKWDKYSNDLKSYQLQSELQQQKNKTKKYQKQIKSLKQEVQKLKKLNSAIQSQLTLQKQKFLTCKKNNQNKFKEPETFDETIESYKNKIREFQYLPFFFGDIFTTQREHQLKYSLISQISKNTGKEIASTKKIYAFDKKNPVSPHKYIDDVPDWVLLFKLHNGYIIGGFCRDPICPMKKEGFINQGFMFSLNKKENFYNLLNNGKSMIYQYNEYYLIIGNSEIRFNLQTKLMESQFGGRFKYFETGQDTGATFFGSNEDKFEIETYEFYHLIFE